VAEAVADEGGPVVAEAVADEGGPVVAEAVADDAAEVAAVVGPPALGLLLELLPHAETDMAETSPTAARRTAR
ncbi:MAG: hypothetical protein QOD91_1273, partial [Frankiales bacterium]|jgi:hypothetical protein|nr:hypothetical protein [Frankiales bacterium]